ncbi:DUF7662 domain-containing protein [Paenibacillus chitinolyticus]|uniref:DUF7662 domain-containing protein n=1 Tax=Paenibacillus chitinolyticus TaxID=79263 RepID=UPI00366DA913
MKKLKYDPLYTYLNTVRITLSYKEIEEIIGGTLPESAYEHSEWWDNNTGSRSQNRAWLDAGWKVVSKKLGESVTFEKYATGPDI